MFAFLHHPEINPVILPIAGAFAIRWYSLMYVLGFLFVYLFVSNEIKKGRIRFTETDLSDVIFYAFFGVILGGRIGYVLFYNFSYYLQNPIEIFKVWEGGLSFHGGLIGVLTMEWIYSITKKKNYFDLGDLFTVPIPFCLALGRWGNFVNGELWGKPTTAPWGMIFPAVPEKQWFPVSEPWVKEFMDKIGMTVAPGQTLVNLPRHPSQLYEMLMEGLLLFIILFILYKIKKWPRGFIFSCFFLGYGIFRFIAEFFREPDIQVGYLSGGWFTMGMLLCIPMIITGLAGLYFSLTRKKRNELWV